MPDPRPPLLPSPLPAAFPTEEQFAAYQALVQYFNEQLFGGELPPVLLTFSRKGRRTRGFFAPNRWEKVGTTTHEISLNPQLLKERSPLETASTLVHELCHLWQFVCGHPSRASYHNREWAAKMEAVGLMPSATSAVGGKRTGQQMSHYVLPDGPFARAFAALPPAFWLPWVSGDLPGPARSRPANKVKYTCPGCHTNVWGKPGLSLFCPLCNQPFTEAASPGRCARTPLPDYQGAARPADAEPGADQERDLDRGDSTGDDGQGPFESQRKAAKQDDR